MGLPKECRYQTTGGHFRSANSRQHVQERIHKHGQILDLVIITGDDDNLIKGVPVCSMPYDHFLINSNVYLQEQSASAKEGFLADLRVAD